MKKNRLWLILIPIVLAALACIGTAGVMLVRDSSASEYAELIQKAQQATEQGDYDAAVTAYENAIALKKKEAQAYEGLIELYILMGQPEKALQVGQKYTSQTGDLTLENRVNEALKQARREERETDTGELGDGEVLSLAGEAEDTPTGQVVLDSSVLSFISGASYEDYEKAYGAAGIERQGNGSVLKYASAPFVCSYLSTDGAVRVDANGVPFATSTPTAVSLTDLSVLLVGMTGSVSLDVLRADTSLAGVAVAQVSGGYVVEFSAGGCQVQIACDENGTIEGPDAWNEITFEAAAETVENCGLSGAVRDATTGEGVYGAKLVFRKGVDNRGGASVQELETESYGAYALDLESGDYTVEVSAEGYITEFFAVTIYPWFSSDEMNFTISPELEDGDIRIVLEWGASPRDLDSYLFGTASSGSSVRVCFTNMYMDGVAELDVDCMTGYGPETITVHDLQGDYEFVVADFNGTGTMAQSGAVVKIYMPGESQPTVVSVTPDAVNDWLVCTIKNGVLTVVNAPYNGRSTPVAK